MTDTLTPAERSRRMAAVRQRDTGPELAIRRVLHRAGFRYRLGNRHLPGSPDIVLPRWRKAVFVHGCFWHGHDCSLFKLPATRTDWWADKVSGNRVRDQNAKDALVRAGWRVVTIWQCALKGNGRLTSDAFRTALIQAVRSPAASVDVRGNESRPDVANFRSGDGAT